MRDLHGILFAYSSHLRLKELTENRTASSIPFGGRYRVIDFMLSNMVNAGVCDVGVIMRENYQSMLDHLGSGKDWDLSRKRGGLRLLPPFGYAGGRRDNGFHRGHMEALFSVAKYISRIRQEYVVLADADIVVNLPLEEIFKSHIDSGADITCVCTSTDASPEGEDICYVKLGEGRRVVDVTLGRSEPGSLGLLNTYILSKALLDSLMAYCAAHNFYHFQRDVLQNMHTRLGIVGWEFGGYSTLLKSVSDYFAQSMNLLRPEVRGDLFVRSRPIRTKVRDEASTYYGPESRVKNSLVADGCYIEGELENCVVFRGVRVDGQAKVKNCILMQDTHVHAGAAITHAITDKEVVINAGRTLVGHESYPIAISKGAVV